MSEGAQISIIGFKYVKNQLKKTESTYCRTSGDIWQ